MLKQKSLLILGLIIGLLTLVSCDDAKQKAEEAKKIFEKERTELSEKLNTAIKSIDDKIAKLQGKLENASDDAKESINEQITKLNEKKSELGKSLESLKGDMKENWKEMKDKVSNSVKNTKEWVKDIDAKDLELNIEK